MNIPTTIQPSHVHLSRADIRTLFGENTKLISAHALDMPGTFEATQQLTVRSSEGEVELPIFGPSRARTRLEFSPALTARLGSGAMTLIGPAGELTLTPPSEGFIAMAHVHLPPEDASTLGLLEGEIVTISTDSGTEVQAVVRISHMYIRWLHIVE